MKQIYFKNIDATELSSQIFKNLILLSRISEDENIPYVLDYTTNRKFKNSSYGTSRRSFGIVQIDHKNCTLTLGYFTFIYGQSIYISLPPSELEDGNELSLIAVINYEILNKDYLIRNLNKDSYIYSYGYTVSKDILVKAKIKGANSWPYSEIQREYNTAHFPKLDLWTEWYNKPTTITVPINNTEFLKYTFGLEFETNRGVIPLPEIIRNGLVPLRDGSIRGVEYATIVLEGAKGLNHLYKQLELLKECTEYDFNSSLHIHLGGFPIDPNKIWILYNISKSFIERIFTQLISSNIFRSGHFKTSGKEYYQKLPNILSFEDLYMWLSNAQATFLGSLTEQHPRDNDRARKWEVTARYHWINLINLCFYQTCKTVEFRFLPPTYNYNKIVNWLFVFTSILSVAEHFNSISEWEQTKEKLNKLPSVDGIKAFFKIVYPNYLATYLTDFLLNVRKLQNYQNLAGDPTGTYTPVDDLLFPDNATMITSSWENK